MRQTTRPLAAPEQPAGVQIDDHLVDLSGALEHIAGTPRIQGQIGGLGGRSVCPEDGESILVRQPVDKRGLAHREGEAAGR